MGRGLIFPKRMRGCRLIPTPFGGVGGCCVFRIRKTINKYLEAFEHSGYSILSHTTTRNSVRLQVGAQRLCRLSSRRFDLFQDQARDMSFEWWEEVRGDNGMQSSLIAIAYGIASLAGIGSWCLAVDLAVYEDRGLNIWRRLGKQLFARPHASIVAFYDRMLEYLRKRPDATRLPNSSRICVCLDA